MAEDPRGQVRRIMTEASRAAYLLCYAASLLRTRSDGEVAGDLEHGIRALNGGGERPPQSSRIRMGARKVRGARRYLLRDLLHLLVVRLDLAMDASLNACAGDGQGGAIESRLKSLADVPAWAVRDGVLLSVLRNVIVHAEGRLLDSNRRANRQLERMLAILEARGDTSFTWDGCRLNGREDALKWCRRYVRRVLEDPRIDDYLKLKRAVRKITRVAAG